MITSKYVDEPVELRLEHLKGAHKVIADKWWEHTKLRTLPRGVLTVSDIYVSTFEEELKGEMCVYRHGCNGFLCLTHEGGEQLLWSIPQGEDLLCPGCKALIPFSMLEFAWMYNKLQKMRPSDPGLSEGL
jgi:hypothetical protein